VDLIKEIRKTNPDIIVVIGVDSLNRVKGIKEVPIIYLMILDPQSVISDNNDNIAGVCMNIAPERQISILRQALPGIKSIGLLYDPQKTGDFIKRLKDAAAPAGIKLITREIHSSREVPEGLREIKGEIDAFWMLPDITVVTPETIEFFLLFSIENRVPVITFSDKYVEVGALISLGIDVDDMGRQAWEITEKVLSGVEEKTLRVDARNAVVTVNQKVARKLGIKIKSDFLNRIRDKVEMR
jgi:putative ABC transport system substrate-binding protein